MVNRKADSAGDEVNRSHQTQASRFYCVLGRVKGDKQRYYCEYPKSPPRQRSECRASPDHGAFDAQTAGAPDPKENAAQRRSDHNKREQRNVETEFIYDPDVEKYQPNIGGTDGQHYHQVENGQAL